jgi:phage shock protein A
MRAAGTTSDAEKFDNLAKLAIGKQITAEREAKDAEPLIASQSAVVDKLKAGLIAMKDRLSELKTRRDSLVARQKTAEAQTRVQGALSSINVLDPTSEISRFEETVRRQEANAAGQAEVAGSSLDAQFEELNTSSESVEIEARLAALKTGSR